MITMTFPSLDRNVHTRTRKDTSRSLHSKCDSHADRDLFIIDITVIRNSRLSHENLGKREPWHADHGAKRKSARAISK